MLNTTVLIPGVFIEHTPSKIIYRILMRSDNTIVLKNIQTDEIEMTTVNSLDPHKYEIVNVTGNYTM